MKCPNCGGENSGNYCQFCGSEMPKTTTPVNITNNFFGTNSSEQTQTAGGACCPQCGSSKIGFKRERIGTNSKSSSRKKYVGTGRKGTYNSTANYRTIGLCQNCGYTWSPNSNSGTSASSSSTPTWVWVLGWIFIFPLPLTVLLNRKKDMNKSLKYGIIAAAWLLYLIILVSSRSSRKNNSAENNGAAVESTTTTTLISDTTTSATSSMAADTTVEITDDPYSTLETYYEYNNLINLYVNRFNDRNSEVPLSNGDVNRYTTLAGKTLDDQANIYRNGFQIVVREVSGEKIEVLIDYLPNTYRDDSEIKNIFFQFMMAFDSNITDEDLEAFWGQIIDGIEHYKDNYLFGEVECTVNSSLDNHVEGITLKGTLE